MVQKVIRWFTEEYEEQRTKFNWVKPWHVIVVALLVETIFILWWDKALSPL